MFISEITIKSFTSYGMDITKYRLHSMSGLLCGKGCDASWWEFTYGDQRVSVTPM